MPIGNPTPRGLVRSYEWITCSTGDGQPTVDINVWNYLCANPSFGGNADAAAFWDIVMQVANATRPKAIPFDGYSVGMTKVGKASTAQCRNALELAWKVHERLPAKYKDWMGDDPQAGLQWVSDQFCGLDCNGFVGNYFRAIGMQYPGPESSPGEINQSARTHRATVQEIQPFDVVVWTNNSHVAIIDSVDQTSGTIDLVQASGGGLQVNGSRLVSLAGAATKSSAARFTIANVPVGGEVYIGSFGISR